MTIESASFISGLNASNPGSSDAKSEGDDHIRLLKSTIKSTFPNITGAVTLTQAQINGALVPDGNGNVGVGTSAGTSYRLDVLGTIRGIGGEATPAGYGVRVLNAAQNGGGSITAPTGVNGGIVIGSDAGPTVFPGNVSVGGTLTAALPWTSVTGKPTNVSAFTNDAGYLTSAGTVTWAAVTGKPTAVSYFTNDAGYQTTAGTVTNLSGGSVAATTISASGNITTLGAFTASGLVYGRAGGSGLGRITTTTTTGSPAGTSQGDLVLVY